MKNTEKKPSGIRFANIIEKINEGFVALDTQMNYTHINQRGSELLKRKPEDLIGKNYWDEYPEDKDTSFGQAYLRALETQTPVEIEDYYAPGDRWFENRIYPSEDGLSIFFNDITDRKRSEQALREKDQQIRRITDATPTLFSQCSSDLRYLFVNRAAAELLGFPAEEIIGKPIRQIMGDAAFDKILPYIERVLKGERVEYEAEIPYRAKGPRFMHVVYVPEVDDKGAVVGWIATVADITERKQDEGALRRSEERLRLATQAAQMFSWEFDIQNQISKVADNFAEVVGFSAGLIPKHKEEILQKFIHPEDIERIVSVLTKVIKDHSDLRSVQFRVLNPENGQPIWLEVYGKVVYDSAGNPERMFGVAQNITESKQSDNRLTLLAEVSELLRKLEDPLELTFAVSKAVGEHLHVRRCLFNEIDLERDLEIVHHDYCNGVESVAGEHKVSDYSSITSAEVASGKTIVNTDSKTDVRTAADYERTYAQSGERAYVAVPLMRENRWVGSLWVSDDVPRQWTQEEVSLLEIVAERTWTVIEKLRINTALRRNEQMFSTLVNAAPFGVYFIDSEFRLRAINKGSEAVFSGIHPLIGRDFAEILRIIWKEPFATEVIERFRHTLRTGESFISPPIIEERASINEIQAYDWQIHRITLSDGTFGVVCYFYDLSEQKKLEATVRESEAKLAIELADTQQLQNISSLLIHEDNINRLYDEILNGVIAVMHSDMGSMQMLYPDKNELLLLAWKGFDPASAAFWEWVRVDSGSTCGEALRTGKRVIVTDVETCDFIAGTKDLDFYSLSGIKSVQSTPLVSRDGRIVGMISTHWHTMHEPSERELRLLDVLARQAADLTERKRMEDERSQLLQQEQEQRASAEQAKLEAEQAKAEAERELAERKLAEAALGEWADAPLPQDKRPLWLRYGMALVATFIAVLLRVLFNPLLGDNLALVTIYGAVAFSVWYGGIGPAILSVLVGYVAITGLLIDPRHIFILNAQNVTGLALFLFSNTVVMALGESMRRAQRHAHQSARVAVERQYQAETQLREKQLVEESLRQSEALYRGIARSIPGGGVYVVDKDFKYIVAEGPVTDAFGLSRDVLEGRRVNEVYPKETGERMEVRLRKNFAGETVDFETEHNGRVYWTQQAPMIDSLGNVDNAIIMTIDITERKQSEEALRRSEERFVRFMQHLPGLAWIKDVDGRYVYANATAEKAFNTPRENLYGRTDEEIFPAEVAAQFRKNDQLALMDEKGVQVTETLEHEDGVLHYSLVNKFPIPGPDGNAALIGGTAFDITERKQAEEALRESEERFRAILRQASAGIVRKDVAGRFIFVNEAFCNMLGYTEAELLGKTIWEFTHQDDLEENKRLYNRAMIESIPFKLEKRLLRKDGSILWVDVSVSPIADATGTPQSVVAIEIDITGRKEAEASLHQLNLQLETRVQRRTVELQAANQSLREEITERQKAEDALHESRKRLQILSQRLVDVQEEERRAIARELHDRVGQSLSALNINLVILDNQISNHVPEEVSARLDDSMQLVAETITLVRDVMSDLRPSVLDDYGLEAALQSHVSAFKSRYGIDVKFDKPEQPIPRLGASIEMTFLRISQEALSNVARHANAEQVTLSLQQEQKAIRLIVQDNGTGITSWQDANRPGSHGLTIMRERAEAFGGDLKVTSVPGKGTKVEVSIPIEAGEPNKVEKERDE